MSTGALTSFISDCRSGSSIRVSMAGFGGVDFGVFVRSRWGVFGCSTGRLRVSTRRFGGVDFVEPANLDGQISGAQPVILGRRWGVLGRSNSTAAIHLTNHRQDVDGWDSGSGLLDLVSFGRVLPKLADPMNGLTGRPMMNTDALPPDASIVDAFKMTKMIPLDNPASGMRRVA